MNKFVTATVFLLISITVFGQANTLPQYRTVEIDGYAARVNDRVITRGEVMEAMAPLLQELYRNYQGPELEAELEKAYISVRSDLVERALIMEAFKARETPIPDQYVNDEIRRVISERFKGDKALFEQVLTQQKKTREEYMDMIREQIAVGIMTSEEVYRRARVTPEQVRETYEADRENYSIPEKVKYSVIVLNRGATADDQAVKKNEAESVRTQLVEGADFSETAKAVSEGSRASEGGAFPWMQPKDVRPELQEVLRTLPAGEISEVIATEAELYIVKVDARQRAGYKSFDEVRQTIKNELNAKERDRLKSRWIARLTKDHYIELYD
jgi:peptidyl-prolyl cis-trans isomerase SurA